jgi:hypothetical protein
MRGIVSQSNFLPWRGYFASLRESDICVFYDTQQYTRRDWRNRNLLISNNSPIWVTLPVKTSGEYFAPINKISLANDSAVLNVIEKISGIYGKFSKTNGYALILDLLTDCKNFTHLTDVNQFLTRKIAEYLDIETDFKADMNSPPDGDKNQKLIKACLAFGISHYISGPSANSYLDTPDFMSNGISIEIANFQRLPITGVNPEPSIAHWIITMSREECVELTTFSNS